ncbi:MAG TPA: hypothetical protein VFQ53_39465 [Kofleriaceae bacterium]|nr:hypothetical protein [Kofleriaceae bacterium]
MLIALPVIAAVIAGPQPAPLLATHDRAALEAELTTQLRGAIANGWTLVDVRGGDDRLMFTLTKQQHAERHTAELPYSQTAALTYRIEPVAVPTADLQPPSPSLVRALQVPGGGVALGTECGHWFERPYVEEASALGIPARKLVGKTLSTMSDLESADRDGARAVFAVTRGAKWYEVIATLDADGNVLSASVRRFLDYSTDWTDYRRAAKLRRAVRGKQVTALDDADGELALVIGNHRFVIDPTGDAFESAMTGTDCPC